MNLAKLSLFFPCSSLFRHNSFTRGVSSISQIIFGGNREAQLMEEKYYRVLGAGLALLSGIFLTLYSFVYKKIENEIARSTVLAIRGILQVRKSIKMLIHF